MRNNSFPTAYMVMLLVASLRAPDRSAVRIGRRAWTAMATPFPPGRSPGWERSAGASRCATAAASPMSASPPTARSWPRPATAACACGTWPRGGRWAGPRTPRGSAPPPSPPTARRWSPWPTGRPGSGRSTPSRPSASSSTGRSARASVFTRRSWSCAAISRASRPSPPTASSSPVMSAGASRPVGRPDRERLLRIDQEVTTGTRSACRPTIGSWRWSAATGTCSCTTGPPARSCADPLGGDRPFRRLSPPPRSPPTANYWPPPRRPRCVSGTRRPES